MANAYHIFLAALAKRTKFYKVLHLEIRENELSHPFSFQYFHRLIFLDVRVKGRCRKFICTCLEEQL